jgi:uncharacterized protein with HEPN domain
MTDGRESADLHNDLLFERAIRCQVIMIGEAASSVPIEIRDRAQDIPWKDIVGMRHVVVHGYDIVDLNELWETAKRDIPVLLEKLERLIAEIEAGRERQGDVE